MIFNRASSRSWMAAEARAATLRSVSRPSLGDVFRSGFMNGSMLQMAVCSPPRSAATVKAEQRYSAVFVTRMGAKTPLENEVETAELVEA